MIHVVLSLQRRSPYEVAPGELVGPNFLLFNQKVAPLTFVAEFPTPHAPVGEIEEDSERDPQGDRKRRIV
jgi:hypothetical protein